MPVAFGMRSSAERLLKWIMFSVLLALLPIGLVAFLQLFTNHGNLDPLKLTEKGELLIITAALWGISGLISSATCMMMSDP
jgi:hypothetical protein